MRRRNRLKSEINVVPYIDVMLVLLVIFMVTAPLQPSGVINLPSVGKSEQPPKGPQGPLTVRLDAKGRLSILGGAGGEQTGLNQKELVARVLVLSPPDAEPPRPVLIEADKNVRYEDVLKVMSALQQSQVKRVGLMVKTDP